MHFCMMTRLHDQLATCVAYYCEGGCICEPGMVDQLIMPGCVSRLHAVLPLYTVVRLLC